MASSYRSARSSYKYTPRSVRIKEKNIRKRLIWNIIIGVIILYLVFFWALPNLISGLSIFDHNPANKNAQVAPSGQAIAPPVLNIPFDATNSASLAIAGYAAPDSKVEIYFDDQLQTTVNTQDDGSFITDPLTLNEGTNNIYGDTVSSSGDKSLPSKTIQLIYNNQQPTLNVDQPQDGTIIGSGNNQITVSGSTDPNNNVTVNGITVIVNNDGTFSTTVSLNGGDNLITIVATNSVNNTTQVQRKVTYLGASPTPTPSPSPS